MKKTLIIYLLSFTSLNIYSSYTADQETITAKINGVSIAFVTTGAEDGPPVLMVMGLMASHKVWGERIVNGLVDEGYRVILFDNRDTGNSEKLDKLGKPNLYWKYFLYSLGIRFSAPYTLEDMANDGVALLDHLQIEKAHIVGASMGGMIAQIMASKYPDRTASLVSLMSSPKIPTRSDISERNQDNLRNMENVEAKSAQDYGFYPRALPRQLTAIFKAGDRSDIVSNIGVPTLVLHGEEDTLVPVKYGKLTAELIPNSKLKTYKDMGHNLPEEIIPVLTEDIISFYKQIDEIF
ncbi:alpha/beta hydrolase [Gammaproteobacteria bacterium]|nr:alpha/beta hydrolase [Gammaproteobacteria bacterium]